MSSKIECQICGTEKPENQFIGLTICKHLVCRSCLKQSLEYCGKSGLRCPHQECDVLLEESDFCRFFENIVPSEEKTPVANHWNWSSLFKRSEKPSPKVEKDAENSSYFPKEAFPKLPEPSSKVSQSSRSDKYRNVMDEPIPRATKVYDPKNYDENHNRKCPELGDWDPASRLRLQKLIREKLHKVVEMIFIASEADLSLNTSLVECLICQKEIKTYEGVSFPQCSRTFCRTCLTQPERRVDDVILLYSNCMNKKKNCAVIITYDMKELLMDSMQFGKIQERFVQKASAVPPNTVRSLVPIFENGNVDYRKKLNEENTNRASQLDSWKDVVLLRNTSPSSCIFCFIRISVQKGVILRDCNHVLCDGCLVETIMLTLEKDVEIRCPMILEDNRRCRTVVQEREIKSLLTAEQYEVYERKCLEAAEGGLASSVHCLKSDCRGWILIEGYKESFCCPVCKSKNCLSCKAIHQGKTCSDYQAELRKTDDDKGLSLMTKLIALELQEGIRCPKCQGRNWSPPQSNFYRCQDCFHVFSLPTRESKL